MIRSKSLYIDRHKEVMVIKLPHLEATGLVNHGFSTKLGGISKGVYESMNLGKNRGDSPYNVEENFNRFCDALGVDTDTLVFSDQVHEVEVRVVGKEDRGKGFYRTSDIISVDGLITNQVGVTLTTFYADCVPLFFLDPIKKVIGLSHAGWRGTVKGIGPKTIERMEQTYGSKPKDILVGIGPSIGSCCYEVGTDVIKEFEKNLNHDIIVRIVSRINDEHYKLDLWEANRLLLLDAGIDDKNMVVTDLCTKCHSDTFYSHRFMGNQRGSLAAMIALKTKTE
ncbi:peptidoglycan editing factor PgeF [Petrocella sp. FN5]|uniref:peptidoglycan editing factor PgeF n=1 Tax=Petrocella sp. FN5 TaxID=3032002 RepID=UPI0023DA227D|nr:peptidoglycan editing factor PgeF [Petrocella sp. FN5]MDF1616374.1 peptidoglycan editing factor PgeF [Petrocella sp. FN5]